jgi:SAM-dependent methyltransferase
MASGTNIDSATRFNDRAVDYVKHRPTYPAGAIDAILDGLGPPLSLVAADLGAGTGISSRLLGDRGVRVVAIEPSPGMQEAAAPHPKVRFVAGRAEATGLKSHSVDLVLSAQSFHWFHASDTLVEGARILKPGGRLAIMWNRRSKTDAMTDGYRRAIAAVGGESSIERMAFDQDVVGRSGLFAPVERTTFPNLQRLSLDGLVGRARSASYCPKDGPAAERLRELLHELWNAHADRDGLVTLEYETEAYRSHKL